MTTIRITVTETIVYSKEYELDELEEYLGVTLADEHEGDLQEFIQAVQERAHNYSFSSAGFAEDLERHGDVQGQQWVGEVVPPEPVTRQECPVHGPDCYGCVFETTIVEG
jgi:hypothetical protein